MRLFLNLDPPTNTWRVWDGEWRLVAEGLKGVTLRVPSALATVPRGASTTGVLVCDGTLTVRDEKGEIE